MKSKSSYVWVRILSITKAIDKKTKKEVAIKAYYESNNHQNIIQDINVSCVDVPGLVKTIGYRYPLPEKERKNSKYCEVKLPNFERTIDFTGFLIIMDYYKNGDIQHLIRDYLNHKKI